MVSLIHELSKGVIIFYAMPNNLFIDKSNFQKILKSGIIFQDKNLGILVNDYLS